MTNTLIIGASLSGLASAACLQQQDLDYCIIEKHDRIVAPWHTHYDRLHLHTPRNSSHLPHRRFAATIPAYPSRDQVIEYAEEYQREFKIEPIFNTEAVRVSKIDEGWLTETTRESYRSRYIIMATGAFSKPLPVDFPGLPTFPGPVLHSSQYKTGESYRGRKVLVVGFGNSACEIAIDLYEQGAFPTMAVRSPVNIVPRDIFGMPIVQLSRLLDILPPALADRLSRPLVRGIIGDIERLDLKKMPYGPLEQIRRDMKAPILDIGVVSHIKKGHIAIRDNIRQISGNSIRFKCGKEEDFDAIVAAIGFYRDDTAILKVDKSRFDDLRAPARKQKYFGKDGLYFCGYWISPTGQIREIAKDARLIARHIARDRSKNISSSQ